MNTCDTVSAKIRINMYRTCQHDLLDILISSKLIWTPAYVSKFTYKIYIWVLNINFQLACSDTHRHVWHKTLKTLQELLKDRSLRCNNYYESSKGFESFFCSVLIKGGLLNISQISIICGKINRDLFKNTLLIEIVIENER